MTEPMREESAAYRSALRLSALALAALAVVAAVVGWLIEDTAGLVGALAGVALAAVAGIVTQVAMLWGHTKPPVTFGAIVAASWLGKMIVIVAGLAVLTGVESLHRGTFGVAALCGVVVTLGVDLWAVNRARIAYAAKGSGQRPQ